jgi:hypothetical protein
VQFNLFTLAGNPDHVFNAKMLAIHNNSHSPVSFAIRARIPCDAGFLCVG